MPRADIAIITVLPEEYSAVLDALAARRCQVTHDTSSKGTNLYGWVTAALSGTTEGLPYQLVVGLAGQPGPSRMSNVVMATLARFKPRYILLVGIAGGFPQDELTRGDVAISTVIYDYEYGKIAEKYQPRTDFVYQTDSGLHTRALALNVRDKSWASMSPELRPAGSEGVPKVVPGAVASGIKVVDNARNAYFAEVLKKWPRLLAIEMEGAGAAAAIEAAKAAGHKVGFMMVRGVSDVPKMERGTRRKGKVDDGNKAERDTWKKYAATVAANFTIHWISHSWPVEPYRPRRTAAPRPPEEDDDDPPPAAVQTTAPINVSSSLMASGPDSSNWLGFSTVLADATPHISHPET